MPSLNDLQPNNQIKVLIYGDSGTGKTTASTTFPGPIYIADFDGKVSSAASYLKANNPEKLKEIEYDTFTPSPDIKITHFHQFLTKLDSHTTLGKSGKFPYKTYVIDSLSLFNEAMMQEVMRQNPKISRVDSSVPSLQDYGIFNVRFKEILSKILALPCNVVVTAHADSQKDEMTGVVSVVPMLSGKLARDIPIRFSEVYHSKTFEKDNQTYYAWQTRSSGKEICRTQIPNIPQFIPAKYEELLKPYTKGTK